MAAAAHAAQQARAIAPPVSRPYLTTANAPALRFHVAASLAPLLRKPIASGPPVAAARTELAEVALANNQAAASTPPMPVPAATAPAAPDEAVKNPTAPVSNPKPILPDDTPKKVQSQDFLPLFRFPGQGGSPEDVTVIAPGVPTPPAPGTLPPSSATYEQH